MNELVDILNPSYMINITSINMHILKDWNVQAEDKIKTIKLKEVCTICESLRIDEASQDGSSQRGHLISLINPAKAWVSMEVVTIMNNNSHIHKRWNINQAREEKEANLYKEVMIQMLHKETQICKMFKIFTKVFKILVILNKR